MESILSTLCMSVHLHLYVFLLKVIMGSDSYLNAAVATFGHDNTFVTEIKMVL